MTPPLTSTQMMDVDPAKMEDDMRPEQQPWFERANRRTRDVYGDRPTSTVHEKRMRESWLRRGASELEVDKLMNMKKVAEKDFRKMQDYNQYLDTLFARYGS